MTTVTGSISVKWGGIHYCLYFANHGWLAADMVQYLEEIHAAREPSIAILRLLGYTMEMRKEAAPRVTHHWVEIDLERKLLATNSELIRKSVKEEPLSRGEPFSPLALRNIRRTLDRLDYTVELYS